MSSPKNEDSVSNRENYKERIPDDPPSSDTSSPKREKGFFDRLLGGTEEAKGYVQHNQVFVLICAMLLMMALASYMQEDYEAFISVLDRAMFILIGFLIKEALSKS